MSRWSMDLTDCSSIEDGFTGKCFELKRTSVKNDPASISSIDRLSIFFKIGSDKVNYGRFLRASSKTSRSVVEATSFDVKSVKSRTQKSSLTKFCTCSKYLGEWNSLGMAGEGVYKYPHGVIYDGNFNSEGLYHGAGTLIYPNGQRLQGIWDNGELTNEFRCGSQEIKKAGAETTFHLPDRRFSYERKNGFGVPGKEYLTNQHPTPEIPRNCYDLVGGIYCPDDGYILSHSPANIFHKDYSRRDSNIFRGLQYEEYDELMGDKNEDDCEIKSWRKSNIQDMVSVNNQRILEIPSPEKAEWIKKYCRLNPEQPSGYNPALYEVFTAGTKKEIAEIGKWKTSQNYCSHTCPDIASESEVMHKKSVSFIQKVFREKRKRTFDSTSRLSRLSKKRSMSSKKGAKNSDLSSTDRDYYFLHTAMSSMRRKSVAMYKFVNEIRGNAVDHSEVIIPLTDTDVTALDETRNASNGKENVLGGTEMKMDELFRNDLQVAESEISVQISRTSSTENKYAGTEKLEGTDHRYDGDKVSVTFIRNSELEMGNTRKNENLGSSF